MYRAFSSRLYYSCEGKTGISKAPLFHITLLTDVKDTWEHIVSAGEEDEGLVFCYEWIDIAKCPELAGKQGEFYIC